MSMEKEVLLGYGFVADLKSGYNWEDVEGFFIANHSKFDTIRVDISGDFVLNRDMIVNVFVGKRKLVSSPDSSIDFDAPDITDEVRKEIDLLSEFLTVDIDNMKPLVAVSII